jgi:CO/xanthine dehydrogenase Mo-binding subunit
MDVPDMSVTLVQNPDPISPSGAKSIGEPANELMAAAIANAIFHATGDRYCALPIRVASQISSAPIAPRKTEEESCQL